MKHRLVRLATLTILILAVPQALFAQSRNTGAIKGIVTDETGGRIPGVLVEISSPDMIGGTKAVTTDKTGSFRFPDLPPGTYTITYKMDQYQTLRREGVRIEATKTFDVDAQLTPHEGEETIVVTGEGPLVDVTNAANSQNLSEEYLQNMPVAKFQPDTLNLAPGINNDSAFGGGGSSANAYQIDGVNVSDPEGGTPFAFFNYNIIQEVQLVALGAPAEYGSFTGVVFNSITKSGSNDFGGLVEAYYFPPGLVGRNTRDPSIEFPKIERSYDTTAQVGGPFIKDKLWYFISAQYLRDDRSSGGPLRTEKDPRLFGKLTWQINPNNTFEFWGEWDRFDVTGRGGDAFTPLEATVREDAPEWDWNFTFRSVLSKNATLNFAYTGWYGYFYLDPEKGYGLPGRVNSNGYASQNSPYYYLADRYKHVANVTLSLFSDSFITGKHDFKFGVEVERSRTRNRYGYPQGVYYYDVVYGSGPTSPSNPIYYSYAYTGYSYDTKATSQRLSAFVQDKWQVNERLTIEPGVRMDFNRGSVPGEANIFRTAPVAPRLGFSFDLTGKKKSKLYAHYGRYYEALFGAYYNQLMPNGFTGLDVYLVDSNGFYLNDPNIMFDPANPDVTLRESSLSHDARKRLVDRDLKHPYVDQYILGVDHDLGHDMSVSGMLIYRRNKDFIESVSTSDFEKVTAINADTNAPVKLFNELDPNAPLLITNPNGLKREYTALKLTFEKRFSKRWLALASYLRSHATGNLDNVDFSSSQGNNNSGQNGGPSTFLDTPNSFINADGTLSNDPKNEWKIQGYYQVPKAEVGLSLIYVYYSGRTYTQVGRATCFLADPMDPNSCSESFNGATSVRYFTEPRGSRRLDPYSNLDFRAEKFFPFEGGSKLGVFANVFNVFNKGEDTAQFIRQGSSFGDTRFFSSPRTFSVGMRYNF
ncbi:MAG TPA: TonB-dependent receptor [Candidatus Polarisedimenticolia bacterium]|jgi:outer membrane receptor protein involved in Fe transport